MKKLFPVATAALALIGTASTAQAATQLGEYFSFSGFGTLAAVQTNTDEANFVKDRQGIGGATKTASFDVDSNLGLQLTGTATPWLSATVQVLASKRDKGYVEPQVEWAFINVKPAEGLSVRLGRIAPPIFAISDSRNIGYANTWVRAPNEVYGLNLFRRMEGVDLTYSAQVGPAELTATGFAGKSSFISLSKFDGAGDNMKGVNFQAETDWATFRAGWMTTNVSIPAFTPPGQSLLIDPYTFSGFGVIVDRNNILIQAEYVRRKSEKQPATVNLDGWYVMGGYRLGKVLPYAIHSVETPKVAITPLQKTTALGVRWDAFSAAALKLQVDRIDTGNSKGQSFTAKVTQPVTAVTLSADFTF